VWLAKTPGQFGLFSLRKAMENRSLMRESPNVVGLLHGLGRNRTCNPLNLRRSGVDSRGPDRSQLVANCFSEGVSIPIPIPISTSELKQCEIGRNEILQLAFLWAFLAFEMAEPGGFSGASGIE
jgi:hypothetical protein